MQTVTSKGGSTISASSETSTKLTRALLVCGVVAGPLFTVVVLIQVLTRAGFDLRRHAISMLSLGNLGWIQIANFVVTGLLAVACAVGMWRVLHPGRSGTWGPLLVGAYGVGLIAAGAFPTDPAVGFPPGAPAGLPDTMSWHSILHSIAFFVAFLSLTAACFVFVRRFAVLRQSGWAAYCVATGVAAPALIAVGLTSQNGAGVFFAIAAVLTWAWVTAMAAQLMRDLNGRNG